MQSDNENSWKEIIQNPATTTHALISSTQVAQIGVHQIIDVNRYSSWKKLLRVTANVLRFPEDQVKTVSNYVPKKFDLQKNFGLSPYSTNPFRTKYATW